MKSDFLQWASAPTSWITSSGDTLGGSVLSSRLRLARNLKDKPFPHRASASEQRAVVKEIFEATRRVALFKKSSAFNLSDFGPLEKDFFMERHLISHAHARQKGEKGLVVSAGENIALMVNEEDHLRVASFKPGFDLKGAFEMVSPLDKDFGKFFSLAYDRNFGFLTACPTNVGTGLRASCLMHLPALGLVGGIEPIVTNLIKLRFTVRGIYGEGTQVLGDLYQISNSQTLGLTEPEILSQVSKVVESVTKEEKKAVDQLLDASVRRSMEDRIFRSLGTLRFARVLNFREALYHLSMLRLGVKCGLEIPVNLSELTNLFFLIQPAHVWIRSGKAELLDGEEAEHRAEMVRNKLRKIS